MPIILIHIIKKEMVKKFFAKSMAVVAIAVLAASCSGNEDFYDPGAAQTNTQDAAAKAKADYAAEFVRQFGAVAPGHTWGFVAQNPVTTDITRGTDPSANMWGDKYDVPSPLTSEQIAVVTEWFATHHNPQGIAVNWCDFFAQQVSSTGYGRQMNHLTCGDNDEHIYNFNDGDCAVNQQVWNGELANPADQNSRVFYSDKVQLMLDVSTTRFGFDNSLDSRIYHNYVVIPGDLISPLVAGMYFLGFDFEAHGQDADKQVEPDGFYNDWIVRVTPCLYKDSQRVIAEDLGAIGDFDFNDVVFDVRINYNEWWHDGDYAVVTLRAAGGRLPLTIGGVEVHEAFGVPTDVMVNTGAGSVSCPVATFRLPASAVTSASANDIPVIVTNEGTAITLTTDPGAAPAKICVPVTFRWAIERTNIKVAYPAFEAYVKDASLTGWCYTPVAGTVVE